MNVRVVARDGLERPRADGEGQVRNDGATVPDLLQDFPGEVEPRGRGGDRQGLPGENGLVGLDVLRPVGSARLAPDVGRQRDVADPLQKRFVDLAAEEDLAPAVLSDAFDKGFEPFGESDRSSLLRAPSRLGERLPAAGICADRPQEEDLDEPRFLVPPVEPRAANAHVVADEDVPLCEQRGELGEPPMLDGPRVSIQDQESARAPGPRRLGDPVPRKKVVEEVNPHGAILRFYDLSILDGKMRVFP